MHFGKIATLSLILLTSTVALATDVGPGDVFGTWTAGESPYVVQGPISVEPGAELIIEPGVEVLFNGPYSLDVNGSLVAVGTVNDSILFSRNDGQLEWGHISVSDLAIFQYCRIEYGNAPGYDLRGNITLGGGIYVDSMSGVHILNCSIEHCRALYGGGIFAVGLVKISDCNIRHCTAEGENARGGGAYIVDTVNLFNSDLSHNTATHMGGGLFADSFSGFIDNCDVHDNIVASGSGGGMAFDAMNFGAVHGCLIYDNLIVDNSSGFSSGGGIGLWDSNGRFEHNTIVGNQADDGAGVAYGWSTLELVWNIIAFNEGPASTSTADASVDFVFTCVFGNTVSDDLEGMETGTVEEHPLFCDYGWADFTLCADSPCLPKGIGAEGQGCSNCWPAVENVSWSRVKTLY